MDHAQTWTKQIIMVWTTWSLQVKKNLILPSCQQDSWQIKASLMMLTIRSSTSLATLLLCLLANLKAFIETAFIGGTWTKPSTPSRLSEILDYTIILIHPIICLTTLCSFMHACSIIVCQKNCWIYTFLKF